MRRYQFAKNEEHAYDQDWLVSYMSHDPSFNISKIDPRLITEDIALKIIEKTPNEYTVSQIKRFTS